MEAAEVAAAALADTLEAVAACSAGRKVLALDGPRGPWLPRGVEVIPQRGLGLAERLACAWADVGGPGVQIGMDTPQVTAGDLDSLLACLDGARRAVLGPADDGGWWAIGLPRCDPTAVFGGVVMSSAQTGQQQRLRLRRLGFDVVTGRPLRDIDTIDEAVCATAPHLRTSAVAHRLGLVVAA